MNFMYNFRGHDHEAEFRRSALCVVSAKFPVITKKIKYCHVCECDYRRFWICDWIYWTLWYSAWGARCSVIGWGTMLQAGRSRVQVVQPWRMPSSGMWRSVDIVWTDVSDCSHLLTLVPRSPIFLPWRWTRYVPPKRRFTQDLQGATSQKTAFFKWFQV
jgi:hypothetical protein